MQFRLVQDMDEADKSARCNELYRSIFECRICQKVIPSLVPRQLVPSTVSSPLAIMAQAPSEHGFRKTGLHWTRPEGTKKGRGAVFLDKHLRSIGYSIDQQNNLARPYTTNVVHCWTGSIGTRDRPPSVAEIRACRQWWKKELQIVRPRVLLLLGAPATDAFAIACELDFGFSEFVNQHSGVRVMFENLELQSFALPNPTAPYPNRSVLYETTFKEVGRILSGLANQ